jgi:hypothetical protein
VQDLLPQAPFWNLLIHPDYLFIKNMPDSLKTEAIAKLRSDPEFEDLIKVIEQPRDISFEKFFEITGALDSIRNENFRTTFPELAKVIDNC